jgi:hypothetical protein
VGTQPNPAIGCQPAPLLTVTGLGKSYRRRPVLRDVGLQAYPGQVIAVTGENGSGKTTLLRICAGLETADTGTVHRCAAAGYCPQEPALFDLLTPAEHLTLFAGRRTGAAGEGRELLASLGVPLQARTLVRDLSGGARQKLSLALALLGRPELLPRELEAVLVLIGIVGIQITAEPDTVISGLLPFHAASQLLDAAVGAPVAFWPRLALTAAYGAVLLTIAWAAWRHRAGAGRSPGTITPARLNQPARARAEGGPHHGS